jgi:hypothetical protein
MSPHRKEIGESFELKFLTGNGGTPHQEIYKNGEDHKLGDAQGLPLDPLNSRFANF